MPTQRIQRLDAQKLQNIVTAALDEFSQESYADASFNKIIKNSGLSKGAIYYYFESKEDLFVALLNRTFDKLQPLKRSSSFIDLPETFWVDARNHLVWLFQFFDKQPKLGRFIQRVLSTPLRGKDTPVAKTLLQVDEWLKDYLATGQVIGAIRRDLPVDLLASMVWGIWDTLGTWLTENMAPPAMLPTDKAALFIDQLTRGLEP